MEKIEILRKAWQQANSANNQELLAMVTNNPSLDERTQIRISQRGDNDVLLALFNQEDLCMEAKYYLAKRGNEEVHLRLLEDETGPNYAVQEILSEKGTLKVLQKLTTVVESLGSNSEYNILDRDDEAIKTLSNLKKLSKFACHRIVNECSDEIITYFLQKDNVQNKLLLLISDKRDKLEIHQCILELTNLPEEVLLETVKKCDITLLPLALKRKGISNEVLYHIACRINVSYFDEILQMGAFSTEVLVAISKRGTSNHLDKLLKFKHLPGRVQEVIVKRGDKNQIFSIMERDDFAETAMLAIVKTQEQEYISVLIQGGNVPFSVQTATATLNKEMYNKELIKAKTLSPKAQELLAKTNKKEFILPLLEREDIHEKAVIAIAEFCLKKKIRSNSTSEIDVLKQDCIRAILRLKKIAPEVQVMIARTQDVTYITNLLVDNNKICDEALETISKMNNPTFDRIIKARFDYTV